MSRAVGSITGTYRILDPFPRIAAVIGLERRMSATSRSQSSWTRAAVAWREATRPAIRSGSVVSGTALTTRRGPFDDVFDVQRATAQPFGVEPQVVGLGRVA